MEAEDARGRKTSRTVKSLSEDDGTEAYSADRTQDLEITDASGQSHRQKVPAKVGSSAPDSGSSSGGSPEITDEEKRLLKRKKDRLSVTKGSSDDNQIRSIDVLLKHIRGGSK
jgi:hypothetical protein